MLSILFSQLIAFTFIVSIILILYKLFPVEHPQKKARKPKKV